MAHQHGPLDDWFAAGHVPCDEPPGFTEREYQRWKAAGGVAKSPALRVRAELVCGGDLRPGDLFSIVGPDYWDRIAERNGIGERVYIRTANPIRLDQAMELIYRITIERQPQ